MQQRDIYIFLTERKERNNIYLPPRYEVKILEKHMKYTILIILSLITVGMLLFFAINSSNGKQNSDVKAGTTNTVVEENGKQIINVTSTSGGYFPQEVSAIANKETVLRLESKNSYGCERSFRIPSLNITEILPQEGITEIELGKPEKGEKILGSCSMGMYTFTIKFE